MILLARIINICKDNEDHCAFSIHFWEYWNHLVILEMDKDEKEGRRRREGAEKEGEESEARKREKEEIN